MSIVAATPLSRFRLRALSIGQLTFAGFILVLAIVVAIGMLSVASLRHLDDTFVELQRLQAIGDFAEEIDRRMNDLRLAARDFVIDPGAPAARMRQAETALTDLLQTKRNELAPEDDRMIGSVTARLASYRDALERVGVLIGRRSILTASLPDLRDRYQQAVARSDDRGAASVLLAAQNGLAAALLARDPAAAADGAQQLRSVRSADSGLRDAVTAYADAIGAIASADMEIGELDLNVLGEQGRAIGRITDQLRERSAQRGREVRSEFAKILNASRWRSLLLGSAGILIGVFAALFVVRRTVHPLRSITESIRALAAGAPDVRIPGTDVDNEIGEIARASEVFRRTLVEVDKARQAAEQALREQHLAEEEYRKLFEGSVDGIYVTTPDGQLLNANPALARIMGYDSAEQLIAASGDIAHTIYLDPAARDAYRSRMAGRGMVREFEYQARRHDGETLWLSDSATAVRDDAGRVIRYEGTVRDITDQKRAEAAVVEGRRLLQQVIDTVPAVINVKDADRRYVLMNRYMAGIFAIEPEDAIGRTTSELMSRYGAEKTDIYDRRVLESGRELGFYEEEYADSTGTMRQWLVNKMPLRDAGGAIDYIVTVALDIGERKRSEQEMREAKDAAESALRDLRETQNSLLEAEKLAALGRLVAGVAHEVNNPVGISLTVASALERKVARFADEVARGDVRRSNLNEFIETSRDASRQLVSNLNRAAELVQSFKQVAADRNYSDQREFNLADLTEQVVMSLKPGLRKQQVALQVDCAPDLAMNSYPGPYGQVLTNLFLNAIGHGFAEEGGTVTITARPSGDDHVRIVFADDGRGMTDDVRRRAFDPFFTTRREQGGTGLGLHIVYSIITSRLGGRISLTSKPGEGTQVEIVLPRNAPPERAAL